MGRLRRALPIAKNHSGFTLNEALVVVSIIGLVVFLITKVIKTQTDQNKIAVIKTTMNQLHAQAQQALKKYEYSADFDAFVKTPSLNACFLGQGTSCTDYSHPAWLGFSNPLPGNVAQNENEMMNGFYTLTGENKVAGVSCTAATCPVTVSTNWSLDCTNTICTQVVFDTNVYIESVKAKNTEEKVLLAGVEAMSSQEIYTRTKQVGLLRNIASSCETATGANFDTGAVGCAQESANNSNKLFDSNMGFDFQNADMTLVAGNTTGLGGGTTGTSCPPGTVATMTDAGIACTEPPLLCTNAGWVVKNGKCCNPVIPGGGDGWDAWGACNATCGGGLGSETRSCLYPKENYCDSSCSVGQTDSKSCPAKFKVTDPDTGWGPWGSCTATVCGRPGTETETCAEPSDQYCGSQCSAGQSSSRACTGACGTQEINIASNLHSVGQSAYCASTYNIQGSTWKFVLSYSYTGQGRSRGQVSPTGCYIQNTAAWCSVWCRYQEQPH